MHLCSQLLKHKENGFLICSVGLVVPRSGHRGSNQRGALPWCPDVSICRNPHQEPTGLHQAASWCLEGRPDLFFFLPSKNPSLGRYRESVLSSLKRKVYVKLWSHKCLGWELPCQGTSGYGERSPLLRRYMCRTQASREDKIFFFILSQSKIMFDMSQGIFKKPLNLSPP